MLAIRLQRTGRRRQARFRVIVQDSRRAPTSGRVVANLGHYNPHTKEHGIDFDRLKSYLSHGAQPSDRVVHLLLSHKVELPAWVKPPSKRQRPIRNPDKLRRNRPADAAESQPSSADDGAATEPTPPETPPPADADSDDTKAAESQPEPAETKDQPDEEDDKSAAGPADDETEAAAKPDPKAESAGPKTASSAKAKDTDDSGQKPKPPADDSQAGKSAG